MFSDIPRKRQYWRPNNHGLKLFMLEIIKILLLYQCTDPTVYEEMKNYVGFAFMSGIHFCCIHAMFAHVIDESYWQN